MKKEIKLTYLKKATKFLNKNKNILTETQVDELIVKFIKKKFYGMDINIDFKQMKGDISDIYRIRKGNIRVLVKVSSNQIIIEAIVKDIGFRGGIYKS